MGIVEKIYKRGTADKGRISGTSALISGSGFGSSASGRSCPYPEEIFWK